MWVHNETENKNDYLKLLQILNIKSYFDFINILINF